MIPKRSNSFTRHIKTWQHAIMIKKHLESLVILNFHKHGTDRIYLVSVENNFAAKHHDRLSTYRKFSKSDFVLM